MRVFVVLGRDGSSGESPGCQHETFAEQLHNFARVPIAANAMKAFRHDDRLEADTSRSSACVTQNHRCGCADSLWRSAKGGCAINVMEQRNLRGTCDSMVGVVNGEYCLDSVVAGRLARD